MAGYGSEESETENETDISGGESSTEILPEDLSQTVQDNNNISIARPREFVPKQKSAVKLLREAENEAMDIERITNK
jgi:hypothetical protein